MEKKKSIVFKKIIVSLLSILFVVCAYVPSIPQVRALTNVITYNQYGSFTRTNTPIIIDTTGNVGFGMSTIDANLQGNYSGSVTLNYTIATGLSISNFSVTCEDCWITYYSSSSMNIQFNDVNHWSVTFIKTSSTGINNIFDSITINSITNWNMNMITYGDNFMRQHILEAVDGLESQMTTNNNTLSRCETLLTTIANNGGGGGGSSSTVNNIDVNVGQIDVNLAYVKASTDSILSSLLGFLNDSLGQIITLETLIDHIDDATEELQDLNVILTNIDTTLTNIDTTLSSINTTLNNIDDTIDTITWHNLSQVTNISNNGNITDSTTKMYTSADLMLLPITNSQLNEIRNNQSAIYKLIIPVYIYRNDYTVKIGEYRNNSNTYKNYKIYKRSTQNSLEIYLYIDNDNKDTFWNPQYISVEINGTYYFYTEYTNTLQYITESDIEYWTLMSYLNQFEYNKKILDAINSVSIQVTQQDITNTNNNVNNYNQTMNTIEGIETNIINNLNADLSNLSLNSQFINPVDTNVRTAFDIVIQDFILDHNYLAGRYYLILICSLLLLMLGRW